MMEFKLCVICGARKDLTKHHLTDRTLKKELKGGMKAHIEEITLCRKCHDLVEYEKQRMRWGKKLEKTKKKYYKKGFEDCMNGKSYSPLGVKS